MKPVIFRNVQCWSESSHSPHEGCWEHVDLAVARGRIAHLGRPGSATASAGNGIGNRPLICDWPEVCVLPGLINAHDHLELNVLPRLGRGLYANSYEWSRHVYRPAESPMAEVLAVAMKDRLAMGAYKNLLSGVTTVCHHNPYHRCFAGRHFPVRVLEDYQWCHSLGFGQGLEHSHRAARQRVPWIIHAAEGIDDRAASEIGALHARGLLGPNTVVVHGVAIDDRDIALLEHQGASLVWCPSSNGFLFGATAPVDKLVDRVSVALGSDSTLSACGDLLDELRAAASLNLWPRERLIDLVTTSAARILCIPDGRSRLTRGGPADLLLVPAVAADPSEVLLATHSRDIRLLMRDGDPLYADTRAAGLFERTRRGRSHLAVDGVPKIVAGSFDRLLRRVARALGRANFFGHDFSGFDA